MYTKLLAILWKNDARNCDWTPSFNAEYLTAEVLELAGNASRDLKVNFQSRTPPCHSLLQSVLSHDQQHIDKLNTKAVNIRIIPAKDTAKSCGKADLCISCAYKKKISQVPHRNYWWDLASFAATRFGMNFRKEPIANNWVLVQVKRITPRHLQLAIRGDEELDTLIKVFGLLSPYQILLIMWRHCL